MHIAEAYFDESGSHEGSPILCVAGYVIEKSACELMDTEWRAVLDEFHLPFFRMSACAHRAKPFDVLGKDDCIEVESRLIQLIKRFVSYGIGITVSPADYETIVPDLPHDLGSAYSYSARLCLTAVKGWIESSAFTGDVAYFFESGHKSQAEANQIMTKIFEVPELRLAYRYASHTFADKRKIRPLQAADLLAWQWHTDNKRRLRGCTSMRADCFELMQAGNERFHNFLHLTPELLRKMADHAMRLKYPLTYLDPQNGGTAEPGAEMIEGPEAWDRFKAAMKTIVKVPKTALPPSPFKKAKAKEKKPVAPKD